MTPTTMRLAALVTAGLLLGPPSAVSRTLDVVVNAARFGNIPVAAVGDTLVFDNTDIVDHTATSVEGRFDLMLPAGEKTSLVLTRVGRFHIICRYHTGMDATLVVGP